MTTTVIDERHTLNLIENIAREAGAGLRDRFANPHAADLKSSDVDLVTEADRATEEFIVRRLQKAFPDFDLLGEEGGMYENGPPSDYFWVIDPIDGTTNFAHHIPHFSVNIALFDGQQYPPVLAVCYEPMHDEMFKGIRTQGATLNDQVLKVTTTSRLAESVVASGFPYTKWRDPDNNADHWAHFVVRSRGVRRFGAAGLDVAWVAAGRFDGYWEHDVNLWDIAPGILFLLEAGGTVSDYDGNPLTVARGPLRFVGSNGHIHDQMLRVLGDGEAAPRP
jgi:myo-inositol-1(or 4)-monophosphatase